MTPDWLLYLITDRRQLGAGSLPDAVAAAIRGGVRAVQLREKDLPARRLLELGRTLKALTARTDARLLINGRLDVMLALNADGVHLRSDGLPVRAVRRVIGPDKWLGVSAHSREEVERAGTDGADFVTFGPVYDTPSKRGFGAPVGLEGLEAVCRSVRVPVYALGGVTRDRIPEVLAAGARGVAMISEIMSSGDIFSATRACLDAARAASSGQFG
jgi:thiamine-phosphate pyrophosphorylase